MSRAAEKMSRRTPRVPWLVVASVVLLASCQTMETFQDLDTDQDGGITPEEAAQYNKLSMMFQSADDNHDGHLDPEEFDLAQRAIQASVHSEKRRPMRTEMGGVNK
jgi:hypothetical protein